MQYLFFLTVRVTFLRCSDTFKNDYVQTFLARGSSFSKRQKKVGFQLYKYIHIYIYTDEATR